jgi:hypothetical protein
MNTSNNFEKFKADFEKDTGHKVETNIEMYVQYYNARINDINMQMTHMLLEELISVTKSKK